MLAATAPLRLTSPGIDTATPGRLERRTMFQKQRRPDFNGNDPFTTPAPSLHGWYRWFTVSYAHPGAPEVCA